MCLCRIITQEPLNRLASNFNLGTRAIKLYELRILGMIKFTRELDQGRGAGQP